MDSTEQDFLTAYLEESVAVMQAFGSDAACRQAIVGFADVIEKALRNGRKLLIAGNGGSAADAQHIAGEFISRLFFDHAPLPAIALTTDTSVITAVGNDYGYDKVFERQVLGLGLPGDVFLGISTSGRSPNILKALDAARSKDVITLGFTGSEGRDMTERCDLLFKAPSAKTSVIQQIHITAAHLVCGLVERRMFGGQSKA